MQLSLHCLGCLSFVLQKKHWNRLRENSKIRHFVISSHLFYWHANHTKLNFEFGYVSSIFYESAVTFISLIISILFHFICFKTAFCSNNVKTHRSPALNSVSKQISFYFLVCCFDIYFRWILFALKRRRHFIWMI